MKKRTKALIGILTATSLTVAAVSMMFIHNPEADAKNASFNGIENLIKSSTEENPFTVVELVPDERMAKFGYFVEGSEPEDWKKEIALLDTKKKRMDYMAGLKNKLATISASDNTKPLTYNEYKEAYSLDAVNPADEAKYSSFNLAKPLVIKKGEVSGYKMVDEAGGSFAFDASFVEQAGGDYDENVVSYEYTENIDGKYAVKFKKADLSNPDGSIVYRASEIREFHNADEVKVLGFTRYIYKKAKGATGSNAVYEYALSNKDADGYSFDFTNYDYVLLSFEGVDVSTLTAAERTSGVYYLVESAEYLGSEAEYDGVLNSVERYKKVASGRGHFAVASEASYVFVGKGKGSKKLVEVAGGKLDHDLVIDKVFYTGGFKNNNWFENGVFLKNFSDNRYLPATDPDYDKAKMKIKVVTLTPSGIKAELAANPNYLSNVGLFYISGSSSLVKASGLKTYTSVNDINTDVFNAVKDGVDIYNLPALIENNGYSYDNAANLSKLVRELAINRAGVDGNHDSHFVNKSVYTINFDFPDETPFIFKGFSSDFVNDKSSDSAFVKKAKKEGFGEVAESIVEENDFVDKGVEGTTDNTKKFTLEISKARALEYIISYKMRRQRTTDDVVKILDIEPAKVVGQDVQDSERMRNKVAKWFSTNGKSINNTSETQPTTEFIGRIEDLSEYNLIYIGLDTSSFNKSGEGSVVQVNVPEQVVSDIQVEGEWINMKQLDRHILPKPVLPKTVTVVKNQYSYTIPGYTIPGYTIPKTTKTRVVGKKILHWQPPYTKPGYNIPSYNKYVKNETSIITVYNDINMNGLIYSNVGDIYKDHDSGTLFMGGLLDTDYVKKGSKFNNIEAYKDADPNSDSIKLNYKPNLAEWDYHNGSVYENKTYTGDINFRFPGNDITEEKLRKLKEYIESGYPIVFADGFVNRNGGNITVNDFKIDNSSRMYELVEYAIKFRQDNPSKNNVIFEGANESLDGVELNSLITNINLPKPEILLEEQHYEKDIDIPERITDYTRIDNRTLEINFKLLNKGFESDNTKFKLSLYVDSNFDGKLSGTREIVDRLYYDIFKDNVIYKGDLTASSTSWYKVSYKLPKNYVGVIPWKLKVEYKSGNGLKRYANVTGMGYVKRTGEKQKIKVLQIKSTEYIKSHLNQIYAGQADFYKYNASIKFFTKAERDTVLSYWDNGVGVPANKMVDGVPQQFYQTRTTFDMGKGKDSTFNELLSKVDDFDIDIDSIGAYDYIDKYDKWCQKNKNEGKNKRPEEFFDEFPIKAGETKQYDMLVLGFADAFQLPNVKDCLEPIQGYIDDGKPVLFSHDCTSLTNYRGASHWNYDFNRMIRGQVGLDRYGVLNNWALRVGTGSNQNDSATSYNAVDYPTIKANTSENAMKSSELYNIAKSNAERDKNDKKDIAYIPRSNKTKIAKEVQGLTYGNLILSTWIKNGHNYTQKTLLKGMTAFKDSKRAEQINQGQITTYPFKIKEVLDIALTHFQPYQLDLNEDEDKDGESDLIVWYTLMSSREEADNPSHAYNMNPRDVRNNYYIYTKGNITYSGVGHSKVTDREEMKLYINTLIAAYKAAMIPPSIKFKETGASDAAEKTVSYISYDVSSDASNKGVVTDDKEKVYFTPVDYNSFVKNINPDMTRVLVKPMNSSGGLYRVFTYDGIEMTSTPDSKYGMCYILKSGERYYFEVPLSELGGDKNKIDINVFAKSRVAKTFRNPSTTKFEYSSETTSTYIVQKRGLFDLD